MELIGCARDSEVWRTWGPYATDDSPRDRWRRTLRSFGYAGTGRRADALRCLAHYKATIRKLFVDEAGVIRLGHSLARGRRQYFTLRILRFLADRVFGQMTIKPAGVRGDQYCFPLQAKPRSRQSPDLDVLWCREGRQRKPSDGR